jgi:hypothetical protein
LGLQAHSEIVTVEIQFVPPSELTGLMIPLGPGLLNLVISMCK